ncbi:MAG TPA: Uma2 family endonuclease [Lamprocystis sp. (in: g-proteobacteria)]|nr:Uma2 family endonuclease [Lamprocystis sp. (in: g-proteobacteria)]
MNPLVHFDPDDPYPESDGLPLAENAEQYEWLVKIKENLEILFAQDPNVFIAGDLFWYPVPERRITGPVAPDVMVAIGRPKERRGCYKQWEEGGIAPQVVFEILSPANSQKEMADKLAFYDTYGVEEYYVYDPSPNTLEVWLRQDGRLRRMSHLKGWTSPRLGIRFDLMRETLAIFSPQGQPFLTSVELAGRLRRETERAQEEANRAVQAQEERTRADREAAQAQQERAHAAQEARRADQEHDRAERLAERLRTLGVEP